MKRSSAFRFAILILAIQSAASVAFAEPIGRMQRLQISGYAFATNMDFRDAYESFAEIVGEDPGNAVAHFLEAMTAYWEVLLDPASVKRERQFSRLAEETISRAEDNLSRDPNDIDSRFALGITEVYRGINDAARERWFAAARDLHRGVKQLQIVLARDPEYFDAEAGLGLANCYAGLIPERLSFVGALFGLPRGGLKAGIAQLRIAAEKGAYMQAQATWSLAQTLTRIGASPEETGRLCRDLVARYPHNVFFAMTLADHERARGNHDRALELLNRVLSSSRRLEDRGAVSVAHYLAGVVFYERGAHPEALRHLELSRGTFSVPERTADPSYPLASYFAGLIRELDGDRQGAVARYREAKEYGSRQVAAEAARRLARPLSSDEVQLLAARNLARNRRYVEALALYSIILSHPHENGALTLRDRAEASYETAGLFARTGDYANGRRFLNEAIRLSAGDRLLSARAHLELARYAEAQGRFDEMNNELELAEREGNAGLRYRVEELRARHLQER